MFKKSFKDLNFSLNGRHPKFTVLLQFGAQCTAGKPNILLKTKIFSVPKNDRILVKLNKKTFFGPKLGLNCPRQRVIKNSDIVCNMNIPLHVLDVQFQFLCICRSRLYSEKALRVFGLGPNCAYFGGL